MGGHLAADPEMRTTETADVSTEFALATERKSGTKEICDYHRIVVNKRKLAVDIDKFLQKGDCVLVEGELVNTSFEDRERVRHFRTEIVAHSVKSLELERACESK